MRRALYTLKQLLVAGTVLVSGMLVVSWWRPDQAMSLMILGAWLMATGFFGAFGLLLDALRRDLPPDAVMVGDRPWWQRPWPHMALWAFGLWALTLPDLSLALGGAAVVAVAIETLILFRIGLQGCDAGWTWLANRLSDRRTPVPRLSRASLRGMTVLAAVMLPLIAAAMPGFIAERGQASVRDAAPGSLPAPSPSMPAASASEPGSTGAGHP